MAPPDASPPSFCTACGANWGAQAYTPACPECEGALDALRPPPALPAHRYPPWLLACTAAVVLAALYSLMLLPAYYPSARLLTRAESVMTRHQDSLAQQQLQDVLQAFPSSKRARIDLAIVCFRSSSPANQAKGMTYLADITLDKDEWRRVSAVLPPQWREAFQPVKR